MRSFLKDYLPLYRIFTQLIALTAEITEETSMVVNCTSVRANMDAEGKECKKLTMHLKTKRSLVREK